MELKEVDNIIGNDSVHAQPEEEPCGNMITEMLLPGSDHAYMT